MKRALVALFAATALVAAGCGSDNDDSGSPGTSGVGESVGQEVQDGKQGGDITFLTTGDIDYMDPGQTYYTFGIAIHTATGRPLYFYKPDDSETAVPDLADGPPQVSEDNKTITIKLKSGVKYAPPVNRDVTSADVKYAIERAFTTSVPNGYATVYFNDIVGAPENAPVKLKDLEPFEGLETPDDQTLVIKLSKPTASNLVPALVMPITIPVPEEYAGKFDKNVPTTYTEYMTSSGPYMVKNDPKTGELTGFDVGKKIELVRNPNWNDANDDRPAYLDSITFDEGFADETVASRRILEGQGLMGMDSSAPPPIVLKDILTNKTDQYGRVPSGGAHWDSLNTQLAPFDNINIRKAVVAIANRDAIRKVAGGEAIGPIQQAFIPPGLPGFEESGSESGFEGKDWLASETGDEAVARKYMDLAEEDGEDVKNGKYVGSEEITMAVNNTPDGLKHAQTLASDMEKLGFEVNIRQVTQDTLYSKVCAIPKSTPHMCVGVGWVKDFQDAASMLNPIFTSSSIRPANNVNWSLLQVPEVDKALDDATKIEPGPERDEAFAKANELIVDAVPAVPNTWDDSFQLQSKDVAGVMNGYTTTWDFNYSSMK